MSPKLRLAGRPTPANFSTKRFTIMWWPAIWARNTRQRKSTTIDGEEAFRQLRARSAERRRSKREPVRTGPSRFTAADRLLEGFYRTFRQLAQVPGMGHKRDDLTQRNVLFWALYSYLIIYTSSRPLRIVRIIHAKRDVKRLLKR